MKYLALVIGIVLAASVYGQEKPNTWTDKTEGTTNEKVYVGGIDSLEVGSVYSIVALNRDLPAFQEVIDEAVRVLEANGIEFKDQYNSDSDFKFKDPEKASDVHFKIVRGGSVQISWVISTDNGIAVLAFLFLETTGFNFEVDPRYI